MGCSELHAEPYQAPQPTPFLSQIDSQLKAGEFIMYCLYRKNVSWACTVPQLVHRKFLGIQMADGV